MIALAIVLGVIGYSLICGMVGAASRPFLYKRMSYSGDVVVVGNALAVFWPVALPIILGILAGNALTNNSGDSRRSRKQEKELSEARHQAELATIKRRADAELDRQLEALGRK